MTLYDYAHLQYENRSQKLHMGLETSQSDLILFH